jgi:hypothetical protein
MACCIVVAYLFANIRRRARRKSGTPEESDWLAYYYETSVKSQVS